MLAYRLRQSCCNKDKYMSPDNERIHFDIALTTDNQVTIEAEGCSLTSEYIEDKSVQRKTMNPVKILFSAFAL